MAAIESKWGEDGENLTLTLHAQEVTELRGDITDMLESEYGKGFVEADVRPNDVWWPLLKALGGRIGHPEDVEL